MKRLSIIIVVFFISFCAVNFTSAFARMYTLRPDLSDTPGSSWSTGGLVEFGTDASGNPEMRILDGVASGADFDFAGIFLNYQEGREVGQISARIMIPTEHFYPVEYTIARDTALGVTIMRQTDQGNRIQMRVVMDNGFGSPTLAAQVFNHPLGGDPNEIGDSVLMDGSLDTFYELSVVIRGKKVFFYVNNNKIRTWELDPKDWGDTVGSDAYAWAFTYEPEDSVCGSVQDLMVRYKE